MITGLAVVVFAPHRLYRTVEVARLLRGQMPAGPTIVVINGGQLAVDAVVGAFQGIRDLTVCRHDNTGAEFGGYQFALSSMPVDLERLIVMNDTTGSHTNASRPWLRSFVVKTGLHIPGHFVGKIDHSPRVLRLRGLQAARWVRSNIFSLDAHALSMIDHTVYVPELSHAIVESPDEREFFSGVEDPVLREKLTDWLFTPGPYSWYGAQPLGVSNYIPMAFKARAILQEKYLSMRLDAKQCSFSSPSLGGVTYLEHGLEKIARQLIGKASKIAKFQ